MNPPKLEHYVNDVSKVLSESVRHEANERLKNHDTQTTVQSVVYLFPHRQGRDLLDIGLEIFNENGIGQKDTNNGLLLIVATEEKKLRIITGKGMEFEWNTEKCKYIVEQILRPLLNAGKYDEMAKAWCDCVEKWDKLVIKKTKIIKYAKQPKTQKQWENYLMLTLIACFIEIVASFLIWLFLYHGIAIYIVALFPTVLWGIIFLWYFVSQKEFTRLKVLWILYVLLSAPWVYFLWSEYLDFSAHCVQEEKCLNTDGIIKKWWKLQAIHQAEVDLLIEEDKRLHPEKYQSSSNSSDDSDSSWSSSDSDFGWGGGSSNGGGYGD